MYRMRVRAQPDQMRWGFLFWALTARINSHPSPLYSIFIILILFVKAVVRRSQNETCYIRSGIRCEDPHSSSFPINFAGTEVLCPSVFWYLVLTVQSSITSPPCPYGEDLMKCCLDVYFVHSNLPYQNDNVLLHRLPPNSIVGLSRCREPIPCLIGQSTPICFCYRASSLALRITTYFTSVDFGDGPNGSRIPIRL